MLSLLEEKISDFAYIDVEMNALEDTYIKIVKAEEKLEEIESLDTEVFQESNDLENNFNF